MIKTARWSPTFTPLRRRYVLALAAGLAAAVAGLWMSQRPLYYPGLSPIAGHRLWNATQPRGLQAAFIKQLQAGWLEATPCEYEIMGWDAAGALYFEALCAGQLQMWTALPEVPDSVRRIGQVPPGLVAWPLSKNALLPLVRAPGVLPLSAEPFARRVHIQSQPYPSPDGAWLAFVSQHIFGPQDVLLLSAALATDP